jgi:16S rRNA (cytosine1402-N4)-methyltransferase
MTTFAHTPVMVDEVVDLFGPVPAGLLVDATVGGGGHAEALLTAHQHLSLLGLDRDQDALAASSARLAPFGDRVTLRHTRFDHLTDEVHALGIDQVSGVLADLGVSSPQLDRPERGFSYRSDAPLDMRMDRTQERTVADVVNTLPEGELAALLRDAGGERFARPIARAIVAARPLERTDELAEVIRSAIPAPARRHGGDPARKSFQALRIEVNDELEILAGTLDQAIALLRPAGRAAVLAYHSGEDTIVKRTFRSAATGDCTCPPNLPCGCGARPTVRLLKQGAWKATAAEIAANRRSESVRLRAVEKLPLEDPA